SANIVCFFIFANNFFNCFSFYLFVGYLPLKIKIMDTVKFFELAAYTVPALVTGAVSYYFFNLHIKKEDSRRRFLLRKDIQKDTLPLRLQAYERMALFLELIDPSNLLIRVVPQSSDKHEYEALLVYHIETEFEHNITQQIYISDKCWSIINTAKNTLIQTIRKANMSDKIDTADKLREVILTDLLDKQSPSSVALAFLKNEVSEILE